MSLSTQTPPYKLEPDEKAVMVVVYTPGFLFRGEIVVKKIIRVSTWLRTNTAPERVCLYNTKAIITSSGSPSQPMHFTEAYIDTDQIEAMHLLPPAREPLDYDPAEPHRRMQPVSVLLGNFRLDAKLRLSTQTSLANFLDVSRETFLPLYEVKITNQFVPSIGELSVPFVLARQETCILTIL